METNKIEQLLRDSFPFAAHWHFRCTEGHVYYLASDEDSIALHQHHSPDSWGAKLEGSPYWNLAANEGATPGEAVSNLQQAIAQVVAFAEYSSAVTALNTFRQYCEAAETMGGTGRLM